MHKMISWASGLLMILIPLCAVGGDQPPDPDLISPGATVLAYCHSDRFDLDAKYFALLSASGTQKGPLNWTNCRLISIKEATPVGLQLNNTKIEKGDFDVILVADVKRHGEIVAQIKMDFLLRRFDGLWKIYGYSAFDPYAD